jgi:hypothetical protein
MELTKIDEARDNIEKYFQGKYDALNKFELALIEKWQDAYAIMKNNPKHSVAVKKYIVIREGKGDFLSLRQAMIDLRNAAQVFAPIDTMHVEMIRVSLTENIMKRMRKMQKRAEMMFELEGEEGGRKTTKDLVAFERLIKLVQNDEERIIKLNRLDSIDPDKPDFSKVQMTQINVNINSDNMSILKKITESGALDLSKIEDQDYTDV